MRSTSSGSSSFEGNAVDEAPPAMTGVRSTSVAEQRSRVPVCSPHPAPQSIFTGGGSKDPLDISQWKYKDGAVPDKDDITNAYAAAYNANGDLVIRRFRSARSDRRPP